jgi:GNAT superfamily N-acetyltransferase
MNNIQSFPKSGIEKPHIKLELTESHDLLESLNYVNNIRFDSEYANWETRVPQFLNEYNGSWRFIQMSDPDGVACGFCITSDSEEKLNKWSKKFQSEGWTDVPIDIKGSAQFAYFYIIPEKRGQGWGTQAIKDILDNERQRGKKTIYGFSRYPAVIGLYQKMGAHILNQQKGEKEIRTYYYWNLMDQKK